MLFSLDGDTRLHLIIGDPVSQTKSPAGLTEEFALRNVNAVCVPVHVGAQDFDQFLSAAKRVRNLDGIIITMPHKFAALPHCEEVSERARFLRAVNVLYRVGGGRWGGDMTDGIATVGALRQAGCEPGGRRALLVGAGGAGSAVALALIEAGVATLVVADRDAGRRDALVKRLAEQAPTVARPGSPDAAGYDLIVNATPAGMHADDPLPVDLAGMDCAAWVADLITRPAMTPLLVAARRCGAMIVTGEDMFAVQAGVMADIFLASATSEQEMSDTRLHKG
jgi:shikimate dehydrogenase